MQDTRLKQVNLCVAVLSFAVCLTLGVPLHAKEKATKKHKPLTLENARRSGRATKSLPKWSWRPGHNTLMRVRRKGPGRRAKRVIETWDPLTDKHKDIADLAAIKAHAKAGGPSARGIGRSGAPELVWAKDGKHVCVRVRSQLLWHDLSTGETRPLASSDKPISDVQVSPKGDFVSYCKDHDVHVVETRGGPSMLMSSGGSDLYRNGSLDWLYPEEFGLRHGVWWAPGDQGLLWLRLDQTNVPTFSMPDMLHARGAPKVIRYPKVGDPNPKATLFYKRITSPIKNDTMPVSYALPLKDAHYIIRISWSPDSRHAAILSLDRAQQVMRIHVFDRRSRQLAVAVTETSDTWIEDTPTPRWITNNAFLYLAERDDDRRWMRAARGAKGGWASEAITPRSLTAGRLLHVRADPPRIVYAARTRERWGDGVYMQRIEAGVEPTEIKFPDAWQRGETPGTHRFTVNDAGTRGLLSHSSTTSPKRRALVTFGEGDAPTYQLLDDARVAKTDNYPWATFEEGELPINEDGVKGEIRYRLFKPHDFDSSKVYPLLVHTYAGPDSQMVRDAWERRIGWQTFLTQQGYLVLHADGRGTAGQGMSWLKATRGKLSLVEVADQARIAKHIAKRPYVDANRIGIWGWSYGGTMACQGVIHHRNVFAAGVAVAPVTDWRFYDTAYTERYMGLLDQNKKAYDATSAVKHADGSTRPLLLLHGLHDNNVHAQNTVELVESLLRARNKDYEVMLYPRRGHGIGNTGNDVQRRMLRFFEKHLLEGRR